MSFIYALSLSLSLLLLLLLLSFWLLLSLLRFYLLVCFPFPAWRNTKLHCTKHTILAPVYSKAGTPFFHSSLRNSWNAFKVPMIRELVPHTHINYWYSLHEKLLQIQLLIQHTTSPFYLTAIVSLNLFNQLRRCSTSSSWSWQRNADQRLLWYTLFWQ